MITAAAVLGDWFPHAIASYYRQPLWIGVALFFGVTSLMAAPYYMGFALWYRTFSTFLGRPGIWLEDLFVREEHRSRGYGRALLDALRSRTDGRVEWAVLDWNEPSIEFYQRLGARPVEGWTRYRWA